MAASSSTSVSTLDYRYDERSTVTRQFLVLPCWLHQGAHECGERTRRCLLVRSVPGYATAASVRRIVAHYGRPAEVILVADNGDPQAMCTGVPAPRYTRDKTANRPQLGKRVLVADRDETKRIDPFLLYGAADLQPPSAPTWFKVAYVVYKTATGASAAWTKLRGTRAADAPLHCLSPGAHRLPADAAGPSLWRTQERRALVRRPKTVQRAIDAFMEAFEKQEAKEKRRLRRAKSQPDEEGWITVGRRGGAPRTELPKLFSEHKPDGRNRKGKRKAAPLYATDFYRFQVRQGAVQKAEELRHKFEQDKKRIALMKAARKFKP